MARSGARASRSPRSLVALAVAAAALAGCAAPDATGVDATGTPTADAFEPGPEAACGRGVYTQGDDKLEPQDDFYRTGFIVPEAIEGFDVLCTISWEELTNDCEMFFSRAYIDGGPGGARLPEIDEALAGWSVDHGLEQTDIDMFDDTRSYGIAVDPADGALSTLLQWDAVSRPDGAAGVQRHADLAQIPLDGADVAVAWQVCPALQGWATPP